MKHENDHRTVRRMARAGGHACSQLRGSPEVFEQRPHHRGIDAAKNLLAKTKSEGLAVQQSLDKVIAELNTVVATITPAKAKKG